MGLFDIVDDFLEEPFETVIDVVTQPARDAFDILEGLSEGEIRSRAAVRLGADIVAGMALGEVIDYLNE